jgi:hypothetical protein
MLKIFFKKSRNSNKNYAKCQIPVNMSDSKNFTWPHHAISIFFAASCYKYSLCSFTWLHHAIRLFTTLSIVFTTFLGQAML